MCILIYIILINKQKITGTDGVEKDEARAIDYYQKAGASGHAAALTTLGALWHQRGRYEEVRVLFFLGGGRGGRGCAHVSMYIKE